MCLRSEATLRTSTSARVSTRRSASWRKSWKKWLPVAVVVAVVNLLVGAFLLNIDGPLYSTDRWSGRVVWNVAGDELFGALAGTAILAIVSMAAAWIYTGIVVAGIRNRPITIGWLASCGLTSVVASLIIAFIVVCAVFAAIIVLSVAAQILGGLSIVLWIAMLVGFVIAVIRVSLVAIAIFDGSGPMEGIFDSWELTQGAVLRVLGWALVAAVIVVGLSIAGTVASLPFSSADSRPLAQCISSFASQVGACLTVFLMAVLYESQYARRYADADARKIVTHPRWPVGRPAPNPNDAPAPQPPVWMDWPGSTGSGA